LEAVVRKLYQIVEEVHIEGSRTVEPPTTIAVAAAVIANPFAGRDVEDLTPLIDTYSQKLGVLLAARCVELLPGAPEAFGKGALVGSDGEIEHGSAIIHTLRFGNPVRSAAGEATTLLPSLEKRGTVGSSFDVPLKHIYDATTRSHHQSFEVRVPDAPRPDEIVVAVAMSTAGRPCARLQAFGGAGDSQDS
jgi:Amino acid synthesis